MPQRSTEIFPSINMKFYGNGAIKAALPSWMKTSSSDKDDNLR